MKKGIFSIILIILLLVAVFFYEVHFKQDLLKKLNPNGNPSMFLDIYVLAIIAVVILLFLSLLIISLKRH